MGAIEDFAVTLLGTGSADMQNGAAKTDIYTVPEGHSCIVVFAVIHSPDGSLVGGLQYNLGSGVACDTWRQNISCNLMVNTTDYMVVHSRSVPPQVYTLEAEGNEIGILPIIGTIGARTATVALFGYLV